MKLYLNKMQIIIKYKVEYLTIYLNVHQVSKLIVISQKKHDIKPKYCKMAVKINKIKGYNNK